MPSRSPTLEGFKAAFRRPAIVFAEIIWRWCIGFATIALLTFGFVEYLDTLPVSAENMLLFRSRQPTLIGRALGHVVKGSGLRFLEACLLLGIGMAVAWVIVASLGRAATLKALRGYFSERTVSPESEKSWRSSSLIGLNGLRAALTLACAIGLLGAVLLSERVTSNKNPSPGKAALVFLAVSLLVTIGWLTFNWFLSLASLFVVARGEDTFGAIAAAGDFCLARFGAVLAVSIWFYLAHLVAFVAASSAASVPVAFLTVLPGSFVVSGLGLLALLYFAVVDYLYVGRLAAYLYLAEGPDPVIVPRSLLSQPPNHSPSNLPPPSGSGRIDPDDLILSDLPLPSTP